MPILHIKALPQKKPELIDIAIKKTVSEISKFFACEEKHVWCTWQELRAGMYFEGKQSQAQQPSQTHPPICELICFEFKDEQKIQELLLLVASTLSESLEIPNNIFITYKCANSGEVVAGDGIVRLSD